VKPRHARPTPAAPNECPAAEWPVEIRAYVERIVIRRDGGVVGEHCRCFGRGQRLYNPWHYVPVLARKPGALGNGAPFKDWLLPAHLERVRRRLKGSDDGDRHFNTDAGDAAADAALAADQPI
jgi:Mu transposase, C-terminal domain